MQFAKSLEWMMRPILELMVGIACAAVALYLSANWSAEQALAIGSSIASISGTMLGFIMAVLAILASIVDKPMIAALQRQQTGHMRDLMGDLFWSAFCFGAATLGSLASVFVSGSLTAKLLCISTVAFVVAALRLVRGGQHFYTLMTHI